METYKSGITNPMDDLEPQCKCGAPIKICLRAVFYDKKRIRNYKEDDYSQLIISCENNDCLSAFFFREKDFDLEDFSCSSSYNEPEAKLISIKYNGKRIQGKKITKTIAKDILERYIK